MYLTFACPRCSHSNRSQSLTENSVLECIHCGWKKELGSIAKCEKGPEECLRCGNSDLWRQKNFPQWAGLGCVALGAVASSIAWGYHRPELALGILMAFALVDMVLYVTMPDVLVCYRCQTKHHQADVSQHQTFNHELAERYRQERIRMERAGATSGEAESLSGLSPDQHG